MIGFGDLPKSPLSLIDIHGVNDDTIPYDLDHADGQGITPTIFHSVNDDTIPYDLDHDKGQGNNQINIHDINDDTFLL